MTWYKLPIALQKVYMLMMMNVQKPLNYHAFGVIYLNLETFTKVSKRVHLKQFNLHLGFPMRKMKLEKFVEFFFAVAKDGNHLLHGN